MGRERKGRVRGTTSGRGGEPKRPALHRPVLVIDEEPGVREVVRFILETRGHAVVLAGDTVEAQRLLAEERPRAILLDLVLPDEDGLTFLKRLKSDRRYQGIPVLVITGRVRRSDRERARAAGADDLLTKPFDEQAVLSWLDAGAASARAAAGAARRGGAESP
jgi:CheY-like chemotaxis protein